jgi:hypothetical protein
MKKILVSFVCFLIAFVGFSQGKDNSLKGVPAKERIVTGGGFGLSFGSNQDYIMVSPTIGYMLTQRLIGGTGISYTYVKYKNIDGQGRDLSVNNYGLNPFFRFAITPNIFAQTEYEYLSYEFPRQDLSTSRKGYSSVFLGGGFMQPIGGKAAFYILALYNVTYTDPKFGEFLPYDTPLVIRAGITIGNFNF